MTLTNLVALIATAGSDSNNYTPGLPGGAIAWWVCNSRKRQQIGGWLLFYYWQIYSGVVITILFFVLAFQSYVPESYDDPNKFRLFLASNVPILMLFAMQLAVATMLISVRTWDLLKLLRWLMITELAAATVALVIDYGHFPDTMVFDFLTIGPTAVWLAYFFRSKRVAHVFNSHDWDTAVDTIHPPKLNPAT